MTQSSLPEMWRTEIQGLVRAEIERAMSEYKRVSLSHLEPLPERKRVGRKLSGSKRVLPGLNIDTVLLDLFESHRRDLHLTASELMERILYSAFNRPQLSFEKGAND